MARFISFLLERPGKRARSLPLEVHPDDRMTLSAHFWDAGTGTHLLEVVTERPDGERMLIGRFAQACPRGSGLFAIHVTLDPLLIGGWHRLEMRLDGVAFSSVRLFVLGPRVIRGSRKRYLGRDALQPPEQEVGDPTPDLERGKRRRG